MQALGAKHVAIRTLKQFTIGRQIETDPTTQLVFVVDVLANLGGRGRTAVIRFRCRVMPFERRTAAGEAHTNTHNTPIKTNTPPTSYTHCRPHTRRQGHCNNTAPRHDNV
jgi:hypothetical protein